MVLYDVNCNLVDVYMQKVLSYLKKFIWNVWHIS